MSAHYHVVGIGNAIMDVIAPVADAFLEDHHMTKGVMSLVDQERALALHKVLRDQGDTQTIAGGSAGNTMVGLAAMGLRAAYIGKTGRDDTGDALVTGFRDAGLHFATTPTDSGTASARCIIAVTGDGERTMNTFLGASVEFETSDVPDALIRAADTLYLEGYLFDGDAAKAASFTPQRLPVPRVEKWRSPCPTHSVSHVTATVFATSSIINATLFLPIRMSC